MTQYELNELQHIKELLKRLQALQLSIVGEPAISMDIEMGGYKHAVNIHVFLGDVNDWSYSSERNLKTFKLDTYNAPRLNEDICNGCIACVNAHRQYSSSIL